MGTIAEVMKDFISPIEKLMDIVSRGVGKVYEPCNIKRLAKARAYEIRTVGQAMLETSGVPISYDKEVQANSEDFDELVKRTQNRMAFQEIQKQSNIEAVIGNAYMSLEGEEAVINEPVDTDWILRFFNSIEDIGTNEMQELWAKVLAGEIKKPKTFSLRTLETLRNMTKEEAELFQRICDYVFSWNGSKFFLNDDIFMKEINISYESILQLEECGLINASPLLAINAKLEPDKAAFLHNDTLLVVLNPIVEHEVPISISRFKLTSAGMEIARIFEKQMSNEVLELIAKNLKRMITNAEVTLHRIDSLSDGNFSYQEENLLEAEEK